MVQMMLECSKKQILGVADHPQTVMLSNVLESNISLGQAHHNKLEASIIIRRWMELQQSVNPLFDNKSASKISGMYLKICQQSPLSCSDLYDITSVCSDCTNHNKHVVIDSAASLDDAWPSGHTTGNNSMDSSRGYGAPVRPYFDRSPVRPYFDQSYVRPYFDQSPVRPYGRMYDNLDYDNDQVLSSMQQKLDDLCEQLNSSEENRVIAINKLSNKDRELQLEETFGSERIKFVYCGCWHYEEHSSFYNDDGKQGQHKFWGTRMFKYGDVDTRKGVGEAKRLAATKRLQN